MTELTCFKAYDVRGKLGTEITPDIAYRIARAYAQWLKPHTVVLGGDIRETSASLKTALSNGLRDAGVDVLDLGMVGTEEVYFATWQLKASGGIEVTASHNPIDYNGFKLVREQARPISADTGLQEIRALAESEDFPEPVSPRGNYQLVDNREAYIEHLLTYLDASALKPLKLVVNAGNGAAGPVVDALESAFQARQIPVELIKINHEPDGQFPNGIPNPMLIENREVTRSAVLQHKADLGIAWDGDFDRCFLFDEKGQFIEGYYIVGLLAEAFLQKEAGAGIIHDPRLTWNTLDIVAHNGGKAIQCKSGHAFIKQAMRENNAAYGGEMSAHHYFRDFAYCDSGMIPWLLVMELLSRKGQTLSELVSQRIATYPSSGEINLKVTDARQAIQLIRDRYAPSASQIDETDGLSLEYPEWRFNLRASNTEPVIRLNVESRGDITLMQFKTREILDLLESN